MWIMAKAAVSAVSPAQISCPKCGHSFNVEEVLAHQIEERLRSDLNEQVSELEKAYAEKEESLRREKVDLEKSKSELDEKVASEVNKLSAEKEKALKKKISDEFSEQLKSLAEELEEKSKKVADATRLQLEFDRLKRDMQLQEEKIRLTVEQEVAGKLTKQNEEMRMKEREQSELKVREKEELVQNLMAQLEVMKKKVEQGSTERQGEIQELVISEWLQATFPLDQVSDIKKGQKGADVLLSVRDFRGAEAGKIYIESKRTANFSHDWVAKLKQDNMEKKADLLVIVTQALPDENWRVGEIDGVWVCSLYDFKAAIVLLRQGLLRVASAAAVQSNAGDKMALLYKFLTSLEFRQQMESMLGGFQELRAGYLKERGQMEKIWKQREKQLEIIISSANAFVGSIQGIAGASIPELKLLGDVEE